MHIVKAMIFPVVMYRCESWTIRKAECQRIDVFELWCWRRCLRIPWTARRSNQLFQRKSILNIHWKDWSWSGSCYTLATWWEEPNHWKRSWFWERLRAEEKGSTENEIVGWHHWLNGHEVWSNSGAREGQGNVVFCSPWGPRGQIQLSNWTTKTAATWTKTVLGK